MVRLLRWFFPGQHTMNYQKKNRFQSLPIAALCLYKLQRENLKLYLFREMTLSPGEQVATLLLFAMGLCRTQNHEPGIHKNLINYITPIS